MLDVIRAGLALCLCLGGLAACAPRPDLVGIDNPEVPVASVVRATRHDIFILSTRQDTDAAGALFSELRADELGLASVTVSIPPTHRVGALARPSALPPDPRREFAIVDPAVYGTQTGFVGAMNAALRTRAPEHRDILFFVHGFNVTTSEAILHVAQFVEDSGFQGVPVLFTWASAGRITHYVYDLNSALVARPQLIDAAAVVNRSIATEYHLFAHSMGAFLTMEAIVQAVQTGQFGGVDRLRRVVLASPDIDLDLFGAQVAALDIDLSRFYVLLSRNDRALRASRRIASGVPRVGAADADALGALGINAIDLSQIDDSRTGSHSKFTGSPEIVQLIGRALNRAPNYGSVRPTLLDQVIGDLPVRVVPGAG